MPTYDTNVTVVPKATSPTVTVVAKPATPVATIVAKATSPTITRVPKPYIESTVLLTEASAELMMENGEILLII